MFKSGTLLKQCYSLNQFRRFLSCSALVSIGVFATATSYAQGNLLVSPQRLVFEGGQRTKELNLANTGKDTARYLISMMEMRMTEYGAFEEVAQPDSGQNFASKYLRFFPRSVILAPNEAQTVKVQLTKTDQLSAGEYRSHIYFRAIPNQKPLGESETTKDTGITVKLTPVFGITMPVIIRMGESDAKVAISEASFKMVGDTLPRMFMAFTRAGNMSVYGNIVVEYISPSGKTTQVGAANGVAVYTPNKIRRFNFDLNKVAGVDFHSGKLHITYTANVEINKPTLLAEKTITLQ